MLTAEEWIARINAVTISEIQEVAKRLELQAIFFWKEKRKMIKKTMHKLKNIVHRNTGEWFKSLPIAENDFQKRMACLRPIMVPSTIRSCQLVKRK